jgi:hypothetical protein
VRDYANKWPVTQFHRPDGLVRRTIDAWTGGRPGPWTRQTSSELFISGTEPGAEGAVDPAGLLYAQACGGWRVDPLKAELGPTTWDPDVSNWTARARRGVGVVGPDGTRTAYFWGASTWGGRIIGACAPPPKHGPGPGDGDRKKPKPHDDGAELAFFSVEPD